MKTKLPTFAVIVVMALVVGPAGAGLLESQTFDTEASAIAAGWTESNSRVAPNDFGFSDSNNAEGASGKGEAGGAFPRYGGNPHSYYADTTVLRGNPPSDLNVDLRATGRLKYQNVNADGEFYFGWFDTVQAGLPASTEDYLGFRINEPNDASGDFRMEAAIDGTVSAKIYVPSDTALDFVIDWDADGGAAVGDGKLTVTFSTTDGATSWVNTIEGFDGMVWDAFGMLANDAGPDDRIANFWVDDLSYTVIPEPGTMTLLGMGILGLVVFGWRRRR